MSCFRARYTVERGSFDFNTFPDLSYGFGCKRIMYASFDDG